MDAHPHLHPDVHPSSRPVEELLAHTAWLRGLARSLVRDEHAADDLVQEAWVASLASRTRPDELRAWLGGIVRRLALRRHRERDARSRREALAAQRQAPPGGDPARSLAEAELQQRLLAAVLALGEPARATVIARYLEGASAAEIARRAGVPESTVRTRLQRALAELRRALDRDFGSRGAWSAVALGCAGTGAPAATGVSAGGALATPATLAAVVCAALGVTLLAARTAKLEAPEERGAALEPALVAPAGVDGASRPVSARVPVSSIDAGADAELAHPAAPLAWRVSGRVLDPAGAPLGGAAVLLCSAGPRYHESQAIETGPDGAFAFDLADEKEARAARVMGVMHPRFLAEYKPLPRGPKAFVGGELTLDVKLRPAHRLAFLVTDEAGVPLPGAWIAVADASANRGPMEPVDPAAEPRLAWGALFAGGRRIDAKADDAGLVTLENAPEGELAVTVSSPGLVPVTLVRLRADRPPFERRHVVLARGRSLAGRVVDAAGSPVAGAVARLVAGRRILRATSDADGRFEVAGIEPDVERAEVLVEHPSVGSWYRGGRGVDPVTLGCGPLEVVLEPGHTLDLFLVDAASSVPVDGLVEVVLHANAGVLLSPQAGVRREVIEAGALRLEHVPDFVKELSLFSSGHDSLHVRIDALTGEPLRLASGLDPFDALRRRLSLADGR